MEEKYKQRLYGSNQNVIKEYKTSGIETQNWETKSLDPVTAYFWKYFSRFSSGLAWEFVICL